MENRIPLLHYDVRDTIVSERHYREEQAIGKVKSNPKYFYSYAKRFSKQKQTISMLFDENSNICTRPKDIADVLITNLHQFSVTQRMRILKRQILQSQTYATVFWIVLSPFQKKTYSVPSRILSEMQQLVPMAFLSHF